MCYLKARLSLCLANVLENEFIHEETKADTRQKNFMEEVSLRCNRKRSLSGVGVGSREGAKVFSFGVCLRFMRFLA